MKFCIVSPPTVTEFDKDVAESDAIKRLSEHAPIGVLTLAGVLASRGVDFELVDLNVLYYEWLRSEAGAGSFLDFATARLLSVPFDAVGFGTICSTYPLTLRLVEAVKARRPGAATILGGPQASAVDIATLEAFPSVDYILRYEAEESLPALLSALEDGTDVGMVSGLSYRVTGGVQRTASPPVIADLDAIPMPAFDRYPYIAEATYIPLELGRGCPYACTFCSTNDFFRRRFRLKSPEIVVAQMKELKGRYGISHFDLIHDMFTVDRRKVLEFCEALKGCGETFYWNCSARTDRVDPPLLDAMYEAGCRAIFFGIETGSQQLQPKIKKNLVLDDAMKSVRAACERGIHAAASLITGFPQETEADFRDTCDFFVRVLRYDNSDPQLHILAPLADTPLHREYRDRLTFDDIVSDMSHQGWDQSSDDRSLILAHPQVFPNFYAIPTGLDRERLKLVRAFLLYGARRFGWLLPALHREAGHVLAIFDEFLRAVPAAGEVAYYQNDAFGDDFLSFLKEVWLPSQPGEDALRAVVAYFETFDDITTEDPTADLGDDDGDGARRKYLRAFAPESVPRRPENVRVLDWDFDFRTLRSRVVEGEALSGLDREASTLASRKRPGQWPEVIKLSPMSIELLSTCDGERTVREVVGVMRGRRDTIAGIDVEKAVRVGLELLRHDGLLLEGSGPR